MKNRPAALRWITDPPPLDAPTRLSVYGDGYFLRLHEALTSDFPAVRRTLGEYEFRVLVADYLLSNPSRSSSLADLGAALPRFVRSHPLGRKYPFLADLSRLERDAMTRLFADRLLPLDPKTIGNIRDEDWARVRLILDPTVLLLKVDWPVERLWRRRELPLKAGGKILRNDRAQWLLLFRDETWVKVYEISRLEWITLRRLKEGARLGAVLARASKSVGVAGAAEVRRWFSSWVARGLIKGIEPPTRKDPMTKVGGC
ncbi:MAG: putative DNA-binding domain-containing protein [Elusimicrobia bacterium]|nr:putative DNA-binding domain-containing protein [Elusimicrobiota bacterium]